MDMFNYNKMTDWSQFKEPWYTLMKLTGFNVFDDNFADRKLAVWRVINVFFLVHYMLSAVVFCFDENWHVAKSSEAFMIIFIANIIFVQFITLIMRQSLVIKIENFVKNLWKNGSDQELKILTERAKEGYIAIIGLYVTVFIAVITYGVKAIIGRRDKVLPQIFTGLGIRSVEGPYYALNLAYHNFALIYPCLGLVPFHSLYVNFVMQLVAQLQIIALDIKSIDANRGSTSEILRKCYFQHLDIIDASRSMSSLFKFFLLSQLSSSTIVMCLAMFVSRSENRMSQMNSAFVLCSSTLHLLIFCWFGQKLASENEYLTRTIYDCPWYTMDVRHKRTLHLLLIGTQKPIKISVFGFYDIGLATFTAVAKTAYSWCAFLSTVEQ